MYDDKLALSVKEVAQQLGLSTDSVYGAVHSGRIPCVRLSSARPHPDSKGNRGEDDECPPQREPGPFPLGAGGGRGRMTA